jgi:hypothetical protein
LERIIHDSTNVGFSYAKCGSYYFERYALPASFDDEFVASLVRLKTESLALSNPSKKIIVLGL